MSRRYDVEGEGLAKLEQVLNRPHPKTDKPFDPDKALDEVVRFTYDVEHLVATYPEAFTGPVLRVIESFVMAVGTLACVMHHTRKAAAAESARVNADLQSVIVHTRTW